MSSQAWDALSAELDTWSELHRSATFWIRDDDAQALTSSLERLLALGQRYEVPLGLAVIPDGCRPALCTALGSYEGVSVLQHGFAHKNHAPADQKKAEYGDHRDASIMLAELCQGRQILASLFPDHFVPVLVPPWNRIGERLLALLPSTGFEGLSTYQPRSSREPVEGLVQSNCHADLIDWRGSRSFIGECTVLEQITGHLRRRRQNEVDDEPTGVLTHHLDHDDACWKFLEDLLEHTGQHHRAQWLGVAEVMWNN